VVSLRQLLGLFALSLLTACAGAPSLRPAAEPVHTGQFLLMVRGDDLTILNRVIWIGGTLTNRAEQPLVVTPGDVQARLAGEPLAVLTADQQLRTIDSWEEERTAEISRRLANTRSMYESRAISAGLLIDDEESSDDWLQIEWAERRAARDSRAAATTAAELRRRVTATGMPPRSFMPGESAPVLTALQLPPSRRTGRLELELTTTSGTSRIPLTLE